MSDYLVTVCASCRTASCWHGTFPCEQNKTANVVDVPASALQAAGLEHADHYSRERVTEVCGEVRDVPPFHQHPALVAIREATARLNKREAERKKVKRREARSGTCTNCGASTVRGECRLCGGTT